MKLATLFIASIALLMITANIPSANATPINYVQDGDFSNPSGGGSFVTYTDSTMGPWNVVGSVDLIGGYWMPPSTGGGSVDLNGNNAGQIYQSLLLNPGQYYFGFSYSGNPDGGSALKTFQATIAGITHTYSYDTQAHGNSHGDMMYISDGFAFNVAGSTPQSVSLLFNSLNNETPYGAVVGNVSVSATPIPGSVLLFGTALMGLFAYTYLRRQGVKTRG